MSNSQTQAPNLLLDPNVFDPLPVVQFKMQSRITILIILMVITI